MKGGTTIKASELTVDHDLKVGARWKPVSEVRRIGSGPVLVRAGARLEFASDERVEARRKRR